MRHGHATGMKTAARATLALGAVIALGEGAAAAADPTTGDCLAASDASLRSGNQHKLREERAQLLTCAVASCPADIRRECLHRVDEVNAQIPTIIFAAKDGAGNDLSSVKVTVDGDVLAERLEGTALSIDPGRHTFTFETPGQPKVTKEFVIFEAQKDRRETIGFGSPPPEKPAVAGPATVVPAREEGLGTQKTLALVTAGIGVVGIGIGAVFGVLAISKRNDAQAACPGDCATADGVNKWADAGSAGNASTIGFVVGGLAVAGAAVLWFTAPRAARTASARLGFGPGSVRLEATW